MSNVTMLSKESITEINDWVARYPREQKRSAVLAALRIAQHQLGGYLTVPIMDEVATLLEIPKIAVYEAATFYSLYETKPVGKNVISVCTNLSCMLVGGNELLRHLEHKLGITAGNSTEDGLVYLKEEEECLAACCDAPALQVNHRYYTKVSKSDVDSILSSLSNDTHGGNHE